MIPVELGRLTSLNILLLNVNAVSASYSVGIQILAMQRLRVAGNEMVVQSPILLNLDLGHNILIGQLPSQLAQLQCLETLNISHNRFVGSITSTFDSTTLTSVDRSYTQFEGAEIIKVQRVTNWCEILKS
ncbi:hypothetical protein V6N13_120626 [Hibiscus sabdariffa]